MSSGNPETRIKILAASLKLLLAARGKDVRMVDIAKQAGVSRQAIYLHFKTRVELLVATTYYLDEILDSEARLVASRAAKTGIARLDAFIEAWLAYLPDIYGIATALLLLKDSDDAAKDAWDKRMSDMREGCEAAISALATDDNLPTEYSIETATDLLWMMLSIRNWELLTIEGNWSQEKYVKYIKQMAGGNFVK